MKNLAMVVTAASLLLAGNAWAEGCMHSYAKEAKEAKLELMAEAPKTSKHLLLWQMRGLDDAKRSRLLDKPPILAIHN